MLVSHDREFLARTVTRVVELDLAQQQVRRYGGGYAAYLEEREVARRHAREDYEEYADTAGRPARRGPARSAPGWRRACSNARRKAPDNDKIGRKFRTEATEKQAAKARQTERLIERLEVVEEPRKEWELRMEIAAAPRAGAVVAALRGAVVRRGDFTLGPVDLQVDWADRVAITGAERLRQVHPARRAARPDPAGRRARRARARAWWSARSTRPAGCSSATSRCWTRSAPPCPDLAPARRPDAAGQVRPARRARAAPGRARCRPGERTRAALALLQARGVNLLVLDEPTNHLDLPAIEQLESALAELPGHAAAGHPRPPDARRGRVNRRLRVDAGRVAED